MDDKLLKIHTRNDYYESQESGHFQRKGGAEIEEHEWISKVAVKVAFLNLECSS